jgi:hypothetical protein
MKFRLMHRNLVATASDFGGLKGGLPPFSTDC